MQNVHVFVMVCVNGLAWANNASEIFVLLLPSKISGLTPWFMAIQLVLFSCSLVEQEKELQQPTCKIKLK